MNQPTVAPTRKVTAGAVAGGGVVAIATALVALGVTPAAALAGALVATLFTLVASYMTPEAGPPPADPRSIPGDH